MAPLQTGVGAGQNTQRGPGKRKSAKQRSKERKNAERVEQYRIFETYHDLFIGKNLKTFNHAKITELIKDVFPTRKVATGDMKLETVSHILVKVLGMGWMAPSSPQRMAIQGGEGLSSHGHYDTILTIPVHFAPGLQKQLLKAVEQILQESAERFFDAGALSTHEENGLVAKPHEGILHLHPAYINSNPNGQWLLERAFDRVQFILRAAVPSYLHRNRLWSVLAVREILQDAVQFAVVLGDKTAEEVLQPLYDEVKRLSHLAAKKYKKQIDDEKIQERQVFQSDSRKSEMEIDTEDRSEEQGNYQRHEAKIARSETKHESSSIINDTDSLFLRQLLWKHLAASLTASLGPCPTSLQTIHLSSAPKRKAGDMNVADSGFDKYPLSYLDNMSEHDTESESDDDHLSNRVEDQPKGSLKRVYDGDNEHAGEQSNKRRRRAPQGLALRPLKNARGHVAFTPRNENKSATITDEVQAVPTTAEESGLMREIIEAFLAVVEKAVIEKEVVVEEEL